MVTKTFSQLPATEMNRFSGGLLDRDDKKPTYPKGVKVSRKVYNINYICGKPAYSK